MATYRVVLMIEDPRQIAAVLEAVPHAEARVSVVGPSPRAGAPRAISTAVAKAMSKAQSVRQNPNYVPAHVLIQQALEAGPKTRAGLEAVLVKNGLAATSFSPTMNRLRRDVKVNRDGDVYQLAKSEAASGAAG
jgi:hypothetical protein